MRPETLADIITLCVDRYVEKRWTLKDCLERYPEHAEELREMIALCDDLLVRAARPMDSQELAVGEQKVIIEVQRHAASQTHRLRIATLLAALGSAAVKSRIAVAASILMVLLLAGGSVSLAATFSGPTSMLYDYKLAMEQVQIQLAPAADKPRLYMQIANRRLDELQKVGQGTSTEVSQKLVRSYDTNISSGLATLESLSTPESGAPLPGFLDSRRAYVGELEEHRSRLKGLAIEMTEDTETVQELIVLADSSLQRIPTEPPNSTSQQVPDATPTADATEMSPTIPIATLGEPELGTTSQQDAPSATHATIAKLLEDTAPRPTSIPTPALSALPQVEIRGVVTALGRTTLIIDGHKVIADVRLMPDLIVDGSPVVGSTLTIIGLKRDDGVIISTHLHVEELEPVQAPIASPTPNNTPTLTPTEMPSVPPNQTLTESSVTAEPVFSTAGIVIAVSPDEMVVGDLTILLENEALGSPALIIGGDLIVGTSVQVEGQILPGNVLAATTITVTPITNEQTSSDESTVHGEGEDGQTPITPSSETPEQTDSEVNSNEGSDPATTGSETGTGTPPPLENQDSDQESSSLEDPVSTETPDPETTPAPTDTPDPETTPTPTDAPDPEQTSTT